ncbi:uncharacterized protein LOC134712315 isoform X1 [Mytilus trossulus]|uniref:uncharacterized protein LOC134712315 isoform X1 n=1 Tax=Mytilus trossulus TaxID=6551 RepID=UPI0030059938
MNYQALKDLAPCTVVKWNTYVDNPGVLYDLIASPDMIWNMTCKQDRSFKVDTTEQLQLVIEDLLHKPMLFKCCIILQTKEFRILYNNIISVEEWFAVLINPQNPEIQEFLHPLLTDARKHLDAGEKFCLKIKLGQCFAEWYLNNNKNENTCSNTMIGLLAGMGLQIYNDSKPISICHNPGVICSFFPCWLLFGGSCYMVHRKMEFDDRIESLSGIPISLLNEEE